MAASFTARFELAPLVSRYIIHKNMSSNSRWSSARSLVANMRLMRTFTQHPRRFYIIPLRNIHVYLSPTGSLPFNGY